MPRCVAGEAQTPNFEPVELHELIVTPAHTAAVARSLPKQYAGKNSAGAKEGLVA